MVPLSKPFHILYLVGLLVEHIDEAFANNLAFAFGVGHSGKFGKEFGRGVNTDNVQSEAFVIVKHIAELVLAQHAVINEDAGEVAADGTVEQHCSNRRVNTARKTKHHLVVAKLLAELTHRRLNERFGAPVLSGTADADNKILQQLHSAQRMVHLRMELHAPCAFAADAVGSHAHFFSVEAMTLKSEGMEVMVSPWLIQT